MRHGLALNFASAGALAYRADGKFDHESCPIVEFRPPLIRRGVLWTVGEVKFVPTHLPEKFPLLQKIHLAFKNWLAEQAVYLISRDRENEFAYYTEGQVMNFDAPVHVLPSGFAALRAGRYIVTRDDTPFVLDKLCKQLRLRGIECSDDDAPELLIPPKFYFLEPEVAGGWGEDTQVDRSIDPPLVRKLHYEFSGWLGDELLESFPCFIVTETLGSRLTHEGLRGFFLDEVKISRSEELDERQPDIQLPPFQWLRVTGNAGESDFGIDKNRMLVVSERALSVLRSRQLMHCEVKEWGARSGLPIRPEIQKLAGFNPIPRSSASDNGVGEVERAVDAIEKPVSDAEAKLLLTMLERIEADRYGLAQAIMQLIESVPGWPIPEVVVQLKGYWGERLQRRAQQSHRASQP